MEMLSFYHRNISLHAGVFYILAIEWVGRLASTRLRGPYRVRALESLSLSSTERWARDRKRANRMFCESEGRVP